MNHRVAFLVCLDTAMLLLVCVLEPIKLTGLEWHQWLGFALCPLVLLHVVMQWQWFVTQFRGMARRGGYRVRLSAVLNLILFVLMAAVLISGVFASRQSTALIAFRVGSSDAEVLKNEIGNQFQTQQFVDLNRYEVLVNLLESGTNRTPFRAKTIEPLQYRAGRKEKLIARSRERFTTPRTVVEGKLSRWLQNAEKPV